MTQLRVLAWAEGISLLLLLFVAMPLKYLAGMPLAVRVAGAVHGLLFLAFVAGIFETAVARRWRRRDAAIAVLLGAVPFGTLLLDRTLRRDMLGE